MKRLLSIISNMNMGGAETFLMKLFRNLDRSKYMFDFCINNPEHQVYEDEILSLGGKIYRIPDKSSNLNGFKQGLFDVVKNNAYKYVLRTTSNAMGFLDLKIAHDAGARVCAVRTSSAGGDLNLKAKIAHLVGRLLYGKYVNVKIAAADLSAIHTFGKRTYKRGEVFMFRNALDLSVYYYDAVGREAIRREFGIPADAKVVGHVGQLRIEKNHKHLINVFAELHKRNPNTWLVLVGAGIMEPGLRQQISNLNLTEHVIFAGMRKDIPQLLSSFDVFVFPSFYEGMPNAVIEAQSTGLPCVVSDTITRDANITGLVKYLPLNDTIETWVRETEQLISVMRHNTKEAFIEHGYEIKSATKKFEKEIFEQ